MKSFIWLQQAKKRAFQLEFQARKWLFLRLSNSRVTKALTKSIGFVIRTIAGFILLLLLLPAQYVSAQTGSGLDPIPNVYLDCSSCDVTYIRTNITFVNYVRDQQDASIYLNITDQRTGGGGREFTLEFSEIGHSNGRVDTLRYSSPSSDTNDERRIDLNRYIKIGLVPYVSSTVALESLDIFYEARRSLIMWMKLRIHGTIGYLI